MFSYTICALLNLQRFHKEVEPTTHLIYQYKQKEILDYTEGYKSSLNSARKHQSCLAIFISAKGLADPWI